MTSIIPEIPWTEEDVNNLFQFLYRTQTGQRLCAGLEIGCIRMNENAVAGRSLEGLAQAAGFKQGITFLLSQAKADIGKSETPAQHGEPGALDHLQP